MSAPITPVIFGAFWLSLYGIAEFSLKGIPAGHAGQVLGLFLYAFGIFTVIMLIASFRTNVVIVVALADLVAAYKRVVVPHWPLAKH